MLTFKFGNKFYLQDSNKVTLDLNKIAFMSCYILLNSKFYGNS